MNCPRGCPTQLTMSERQGVEIDYCPTCRGVWLDRGELDKVIDRAAALEAQYTAAAPPAPVAAPPATPPGAPQIPQQPYPPMREERRYDDDDDRRYRDDDYYKRKRKKGFLGELFDIG